MKKIVVLFTVISIFLTGCSLDDVYQPLKENINEKKMINLLYLTIEDMLIAMAFLTI